MRLKRSYNRLRLCLFRRFTSLRHSVCNHSFIIPVEAVSPPNFKRTMFIIDKYILISQSRLSSTTSLFFVGAILVVAHSGPNRENRSEINIESNTTNWATTRIAPTDFDYYLLFFLSLSSSLLASRLLIVSLLSYRRFPLARPMVILTFPFLK
jgi:hypothetical protein